MIYNLVKYLSSQLPTLKFVCNGLQVDSPTEVVEIDEVGGVPNTSIKRNDFIVRILSRSFDKTTARKNVYLVYNLLHKKFGLILPEETVNSQVFPSVRTWKITGTHLPTSIGSDENGKNLFSSNYIITTE